jgi:HAMP domain-containing protein
MVVIEQIIHVIYIVIAGIIGFFLMRNLFKRTSRTGIVYDIVYAYCFIPFLLRVLGIK